tara:strand:- start:272 stop:601 length:330 start_codon:yes stop_codon:yes gene_type:complete
MPILVQYKIIDGFNEYNDYLIHQDDADVRDDKELIRDMFPDSLPDDNGGEQDDYRDISVVETYHISVQEALFLKRMFIAFPFGGNEWLRQLAIKQYDEENCLTVKERSE